MKSYWTYCTHCRRKQKTLAKIGNRRICVYCGRSFKTRRIPPPTKFTGRYI